MKAIIHVNQHRIKSNRKKGENLPVLTVKTYKSNTYANEVAIDGPSRLIYRPDQPLECGAHVWIECDHKDLRIIGSESSFEGLSCSEKGAT